MYPLIQQKTEANPQKRVKQRALDHGTSAQRGQGGAYHSENREDTGILGNEDHSGQAHSCQSCCSAVSASLKAEEAAKDH